MPAGQLSSPFSAEPVEEIRLSAAPLIKVIAQIKFPNLGILRDESVTSTLTSRLSQEYPMLQERRGMNVLLNQGVLTQQQTEQKIWSLRSRDERWKFTISENFLALETAQYSTRDEFIERLDQAMREVFSVVEPPFFERFGIRYIDRVSDVELINGDLKSMIRNEMVGGLGADLPPEAVLSHSLSDTLFKGEDRSVQVRCGILPSGVTVFDLEIPPMEQISWFLDIDSYMEEKVTATPSEIISRLHTLADGAYRMFRWVVNEDFLNHFGAE